jgi:hypothetical protein
VDLEYVVHNDKSHRVIHMALTDRSLIYFHLALMLIWHQSDCNGVFVNASSNNTMQLVTLTVQYNYAPSSPNSRTAELTNPASDARLHHAAMFPRSKETLFISVF